MIATLIVEYCKALRVLYCRVKVSTCCCICIIIHGVNHGLCWTLGKELTKSFHRRLSCLKRVFLVLILLAGWLASVASMASGDINESPVAAFDFAIAETLSAIDRPPRFLAGLKGYETYYRQDGVIPHTTNLGFRFLPNYELLASLSPQHILISPPAHVNLMPSLRKISDVKEYPIYNFSEQAGDGQSDWKTVEEMTLRLGFLVNNSTVSQQYIEAVNSYFDDLKRQLAGIEYPLLMVRLVDERHARIYGKGSLEGMVMNRLGLQNAWQRELGQWGSTTVSAEILFNINAKIIFLESPYDPSGGQGKLLSDGQWRHLTAVNEGNYTVIPINYWSWGGFPSALRFAESLVEALETSTATVDAPTCRAEP